MTTDAPELDPKQAAALVKLRHPEWSRHQATWRWLLDSYESGERYRNAVYGLDFAGLPERNLIRHKREYPDPRAGGGYGVDPGARSAYASGTGEADAARFAGADDYELRRARTPTPSMVADGIDTHLSKIYQKEVTREGPDAVLAWWKDVDGRGTPVADWMEQDLAPVFLSLGQIDVVCDLPPAPAGESVESKADVARLGLDRAVASYALPENVLWWRLDPDGSYAEILLLEHDEDAEPPADPRGGRLAAMTAPTHPYAYPARPMDHHDRFRFWSKDAWYLLSCRGEVIASGVNDYGAVPVRRVFFRRRPRDRNVGQSFYEAAAILQREDYNRDSELILSDTLQAHPLLQGPEDYVQEDGTVPIGPSWLLPKKKNSAGGSATYEGFDYVDPPKGAADSIRTNRRDLRDAADRSMRLVKPAGTAGTGSSTVSQSGVSKAIDNDAVYASYARQAGALGRLEMAVVKLMLTVVHRGDMAKVKADLDATEVTYPTEFDLDDADDLAKGLGDFQGLLTGIGTAPVTETAWLQQIVRTRLKGRSQDTYEAIDGEIAAAVEAAAAAKTQEAEGLARLDRSPAPAAGAGATDAGAADDPEAPNYVTNDPNPYPDPTGGRY